MYELKKSLFFVMAAGVVACPALAMAQGAALRSAQSSTQDLFARDRGEAVLSRQRPEYEALGLRAGAFRVFLELQTDVERTDNVLVAETGEESDWVVRLQPRVSIRSDWSRHEIRSHAQASINRHADFSSENTEEWGVGASGRLDVSRAVNVTAGFDHAAHVEPRISSNSPTAAAEPIQYDSTRAFISGTRASGRVRLTARGDWRSFDYDDSVTFGGVPIDQDDRDRDVYSLNVRADYAISPATAVFVQAVGNEREYTNVVAPALRRDSSGYEVLAGVNFEIGAVSRGEVAVGYLNQTFDVAAFDDISGFGFRAEVEWFPTPLTTVTGNIARSVEDSNAPGAGGYLSSTAGVRVDHELLRNLILSGLLNFTLDDYEGLGREDERFNASIGATYLLNRRLGVTVTASHLDHSSTGSNSGANFAVNRLMVSLVTQF